MVKLSGYRKHIQRQIQIQRIAQRSHENIIQSYYIFVSLPLIKEVSLVTTITRLRMVGTEPDVESGQARRKVHSSTVRRSSCPTYPQTMPNKDTYSPNKQIAFFLFC